MIIFLLGAIIMAVIILYTMKLPPENYEYTGTFPVSEYYDFINATKTYHATSVSLNYYSGEFTYDLFTKTNNFPYGKGASQENNAMWFALIGAIPMIWGVIWFADEEKEDTRIIVSKEGNKFKY